MMKSIVTTSVAALFALTSAAALAADKPAEGNKKPATTAAASSKQTQPAPAAAARAETRDWGKIDTNKDNLISPEEMEAYLKDNPGPLRAAK